MKIKQTEESIIKTLDDIEPFECIIRGTGTRDLLLMRLSLDYWYANGRVFNDKELAFNELYGGTYRPYARRVKVFPYEKK